MWGVVAVLVGVTGRHFSHHLRSIWSLERVEISRGRVEPVSDMQGSWIPELLVSKSVLAAAGSLEVLGFPGLWRTSEFLYIPGLLDPVLRVLHSDMGN